MYAEHQPMIARHAESPEGFADVVTFVIATINQRFYMVPSILQSLRDNGLDDCKFLNATQKRGIAYIREQADRYRVYSQLPNPIAALRMLVEIPNIGIVKAGFILQCVSGWVGCLDRRNLRVAGLDEQAFARIPTSTEGLTTRLALYVETCALLGGSQALWDGWCRGMALEYPRHFASAEDVSRAHVEWITGQYARED